MNEKVSPALCKKASKIAFLFVLVSFVLLGLGLVVTAVIQTNQTNIIGGAGWPTFQIKLSILLSSPLGTALAVAFVLSIVTFIIWRKCKD